MSLEKGTLTVFCGPMFSSKTTQLLSYSRLLRVLKEPHIIVKWEDDNRYGSKDEISSHDKESVKSHVQTKRIRDVLNIVNHEHKYVLIDEGQFFDGIVDVCEELCSRGVNVIVCALDTNFKREPFGEIPQLLCKADKVTKFWAICTVCGGDAPFSQRLSDDINEIVIGSEDVYEPRCRTHHIFG